MDLLDAVHLMRGVVGTQVTLEIERDIVGRLPVTMMRAMINVQPVRWHREGDFVYIRLSAFVRSAEQDLRYAWRVIKANGPVRGIVLDMRGNPGGLLRQAIRVADLFLNDGDIIDTQGRHPDSFQHYEATGKDVARGLPLIVLIDGRSASAAEIVAAALQDRGRALVVGTTSYGKGTVQTVIRTPNDGEITLTWSRLLTPSGYALHGLGVRPNICTSGLVGEELTAINRALSGEASAAEAVKAWHRVGLYDQKSRDALRSECPAERRRDDIESRIAHRLIADPVFYAHALDLASSLAAAGH